MSHTPGPWEVYKNEDVDDDDNFCSPYYWGILHKGDLEEHVGSVWDDEDARLIASAPDMKNEIARLKKEKADMLAMLEELRECAEYWSEYDVPLGIVERLDETIKKARGEEWTA